MTDRPDPADLLTIDEVISAAHAALGADAYTWAASGAGQGVTVARNMAALNRLALVPHVLRDVEGVSAATTFLGVPMAFPVMPAPVAALGLYDPADAMSTVRAANATGTSAMVSCLTAARWEDLAATAPGRHFFQLYVFGDRRWTADIAARVEAAGFAGLCVTVDTPTVGRRDRSIEQRYVWSYPEGGPPNFVDHGWDTTHRTRYTFEDLRWLCQQTALPVIAKGIMTATDARAALDCGVSAIYVSNHGGRQIDHGLSTIETLDEIVDACGDTRNVVIDGGFTRGADVCKALALGASVVAIGRLQCWGLAAGGAAGLTRVLELLREETRSTMANIGCRAVDDVTPNHVRWSLATPSP